MTPGARLQAAIEIGDETDNRPGNRMLAAAFRRRRYAGSKDRRAITERIMGILRRRSRLDWWIVQSAAGPADWRRRVVADLALTDGLTPEAIGELFTGEKYCPAAMETVDKALAHRLAGQPLDNPDMPAPVMLEYPDWLDIALFEQWGDDLEKEMRALNVPAPVDVRVNTLKGDRQAALEALKADGVEAEPTPLSPLGLRLHDRVRLDDIAAYRDGLVEVQDEGSQLVSLLVGAGAEMTVFDTCAGAGGKTLALAAAMEDKGRLVAADADPARLKRMFPRLRRAGVSNVEARVPKEGEDEAAWRAWTEKDQAAADRVLVDAPCSGTGAWRRNPDARWQLSLENLTRDLNRQQQALAHAAALVKPGGRLIYATCSVLPAENQSQVDRFLRHRGDFTPVPVDEVWEETIGGPCPCSGPSLFLTPATTGTDGFFAAVLVRD